MATNKNALIRYRTLDKCFRNGMKKFTLDDLIDACSDALYEYEGKDEYVSKRTVQTDIQMMRSDKLGYNAPIVVFERKYYTYDDKEYSIMNQPVSDTDMNMLQEAIDVLEQFKEHSMFNKTIDVIKKLEDAVQGQGFENRNIIHLDKNVNLKGLHYLDELYQSIKKKQTLTVTYKSFKARAASDIPLFPYLLKEFNNRWFLLCKKYKEDKLLTLALDRIESIKQNKKIKYVDYDFDVDAYFENSIGVTVHTGEKPMLITLRANRIHAPYILTKPLHHSQKIINKDHNSMKFTIEVHHNFELERIILGFGDGLEVIGPSRLRRSIKRTIRKTAEAYRLMEN